MDMNDELAPPNLQHRTRLALARRVVLLTVALAAAALIAAGCGSTSTVPGVAKVKPTTSATTSSPSGTPAPTSKSDPTVQLLKFARCMRSHGVPSFPDPSNGALSGSSSAGSGGINPSSPQFQSAQQACRSLLPAGAQNGNGGAPSGRFLKFSQCMRSHGVSNFPDPTVTGNQIGFKLPAGVASSPSFKSAQKACQSVLGGSPAASSSGGQ